MSAGVRTRLLFAGAALVILGMTALVPWMTWDARRLAWDRAGQSAENLTATLADNIERSVEIADLSLQTVVRGWRLPETRLVSPETRHQILFDRAANASNFGAVFVLDADGKIVLESRSLSGSGVSMAAHDFFQAQRDRPDRGLYVSAPFRDHATGEWLIALSRALDREDTPFAGVVVGTLRIDYLRRLFEGVDLGEDASVTLFRTDGTVVVRVPYVEADVGRAMGNAPIFRHLGGTRAGAFEDSSAFDGQRRLFTYRRIGDVPLVLVLGQSSGAILAEWRIKAAITGLAVLGLAAVALVLGMQLRGELRRRSTAEGELARKNATLSAILREMPDGVQVFDRDGQLTAWNDQLFRLADLDDDERDRILAAPDRGRAFRRTLARRGDYGPGDPDELVAGREATARAGRPVQFRRQAASGRWIDVRGVPTADAGWLATYRDVTAEVASEYELRDAYERLEEQASTLCATAEDLARAREVAEAASQSKSVFLANMSHELRTPLNGVIGFADLMIQEVYGPLGSERYAEYVRDIGESGRHLLELINDILDFTKIEAGKLELQEDDVDIVGAVAAAIRIVRPRAEAATITLELRNALPESVMGVRADERRMKQVALNLLSNAIKFTPSGGRVSITVEEDASRGGLRLAFADTGIGIAAEDLPRVMEAFSQVDHGLNRRHEGTGLGLPLTRRLVELHHGELTIESVRGTGTTVIVWLPETRIVRTTDLAPSLMSAE